MMNTAKLVEIPVCDEMIIGYMKTFEESSPEKVEKMNSLAYMIREACFADEKLEKSAVFLSVWNQIISDIN